MKVRTTFLLLIVAVAAFVFIRLYDQNNLTTRQAQEQKAEVFEKFDRDNLKSIEIKTGDETISLKQEEQGWFVDVPVRDRADLSSLTRLLTSLESLTSQAKIEDVSKDKVKEFGLDKPAIRVRFEGEGIPSKFAIGDDTAASEGRAFYARISDRDTVYVIESVLKQQLMQASADFRDRRLMTQRAQDATRLVIHLKTGDLELVNENDEWVLVKPFKARGDSRKVRDLLAALTTARVEAFVTGDDAQEDDGLTEPAGSVDLYFNDSDQPETIKFGRSPEKNPDTVYTSVSSRIGVFRVTKAAAALLEQQPNDLRDRNLIRLNPDIVDRLTLTPAGRDPIQLARQGEDWIIRSADNHPANGPEILKFMDKLRHYAVQDFVAETASDLEKYGLATPQLKVSFSSYASHNTAESAAGENPITTVRFGRPAQGEKAYAHVEEESFVVSVDPGVLETIPTSPAQWRSLVVTDLDPASIGSIEVRKKGGEPATFTRQQDAWTGSAGPVDSVAIQSLANTLAKLRAVRWIGDTAPHQGLSDPLARFTVKTGEESETVLVGNVTPDQMHFAQIEGDSGVFLINDPDFRTMMTTLSAPRAEPAPTPSPQP